MSRIICRNMGDSEKLRFYELDHESKTRLLEAHFHTSKLPGYGTRKTRRKAIEGNADPVIGQATHRACRVPPVWRGGETKKAPMSHPTVGVARFAPKVPGRLSSSCEELPVNEVIPRGHFVFGLRHRSLVWLCDRMPSKSFFRVRY